MGTRKIGPAIAAGCTMVVKPASLTPLSMYALAGILEEAGLPGGVLNVVTTARTGALSEPIIRDRRLRKLSFTGSTPVGQRLVEQSAQQLLRVSMELGGNAPLIVFADADLDLAVKGAIASKFRNAGQTCVCANRILVEDKIYDAFSKKLADAVRALKVGNGADEGIEIGPLIDQKAIDKVDRMVAEAIDAGAEAIVGGKKHAAGAQFYAPTVLANVSREMRVNTEEIFGPVAPLIRFKTDDEAVAIANDTDYGLSAGIWTGDVLAAQSLARRLRAGSIWINDWHMLRTDVPFGGYKQSGQGRELGVAGLESFLETKAISTAFQRDPAKKRMTYGIVHTSAQTA